MRTNSSIAVIGFGHQDACTGIWIPQVVQSSRSGRPFGLRQACQQDAHHRGRKRRTKKSVVLRTLMRRGVGTLAT